MAFHVADVALFEESLQLPKHQLTEAVSLHKALFKSLATDLGIFAHKSVNLDTQLKPEPDARDLMMLRLGNLQEDLRVFISLFRQRPDFHGSGDTNSNDDTRLVLSNAARGALGDIIESVDALYRLIPRIERLSLCTMNLPRDGFEERTSLILKSMFPKAEERLITKLVESIAFRRHHPLYQRGYQKRACTEPGPSTKWTFVIKNLDDQDDGCKRQASTVSAVESLRMDETGYPIPPKAEGFPILAVYPMWWEKHVDGDVKHYICLPDNCEKPLYYFRGFDSWFGHMDGGHLDDWLRLVYAKKSNWRCAVSEKCTISFDDEDSLRRHLVDNHSGDLELANIQPAVENTCPQPRNPVICPLCQESIDNSEPVAHQWRAENNTSLKNLRQQSDDEQSISGALPNDEEKKRSAADANSWTRSSEMELRMAAHIADHLMGVSLLCLGGLENEGEERQEKDSRADMHGFFECTEGDGVW
ncbi:hypothetical protein V8C34DRAFT_319831 [Trichoderma compactum]